MTSVQRMEPAAPLRSQWRMAACPVRASRGGHYGWQALIRSACGDAATAFAHIQSPADWLELDIFLLGQAAWLADQVVDSTVFFSLSLSTLFEPDLFDRFLAAATVDKALLDKATLVAEIPDDLAVEPLIRDSRIYALQRSGVQVAMTGFHGWTRCWRKARADWDVIKLNRRRMTQTETQAALIELGQQIHYGQPPSLVVEGVDNAEECLTLADAGAHALQGSAFGDPRLVGAGH